MNTRGTTLFLCCFLLATLACKSGGATGPATNANAGTQTNVGANAAESGACALLSASDIQAVQGEAVADTQGSTHSNGAFITTQCFYRLPTFSKSVNLEIMRPNTGGESARAVDEFWERRFHQRHQGKSEAEAEREKEKARRDNRKGETKRDRGEEREREREEEKGAQPQPIPGLGDEAFWAGNQINASLYVRKSNVIIRLSIGGPEDQTVKIKKARALAEQVLKRL
ncbi:MAG TPA: hypothetical protein VGJ55_07195 [Pyrinomonadaceae bacterium]